MNVLPSLLVLAQMDAPVGRSRLAWMFEALGPFYGLVLPASGLAIFIGALLVVALSRRPAVIAAFLVFLPLPLLIGIFGSIQGFIASYSVVAMSPVTPKPSDVAQGISTGLFSSLVGLMATFPAYFVLAIGLFLRTVFSPRKD